MNIHDPFLFRQTQVTTYTDIEIRQFQTPPVKKATFVTRLANSAEKPNFKKNKTT